MTRPSSTSDQRHVARARIRRRRPRDGREPTVRTDRRRGSQRQRLATDLDVGRQRDRALEDRHHGVAPFELAPADEPPVDEAHVGREDARGGRPSRARCRRRRSGRASSRGRRPESVRAARPRAQLLEARQRGRLVAVVEQLVAQRPGRRGRSRPRVTMYSIAPPPSAAWPWPPKRDAAFSRRRRAPRTRARQSGAISSHERYISTIASGAAAAAPSPARGGRPARSRRRSSRRAALPVARVARRQTRATRRSGSVCAPISSKRSRAAPASVSVEHLDVRDQPVLDEAQAHVLELELTAAGLEMAAAR